MSALRKGQISDAPMLLLLLLQKDTRHKGWRLKLLVTHAYTRRLRPVMTKGPGLVLRIVCSVRYNAGRMSQNRGHHAIPIETGK